MRTIRQRMQRICEGEIKGGPFHLLLFKSASGWEGLRRIWAKNCWAVSDWRPALSRKHSWAGTNFAAGRLWTDFAQMLFFPISHLLTDSSCASQQILTFFSLRIWSVDIYLITFQSLWASCAYAEKSFFEMSWNIFIWGGTVWQVLIHQGTEKAQQKLVNSCQEMRLMSTMSWGF